MKTGIQISSVKPILTTEEQVQDTLLRLARAGYRYAQLQWIDPSVSPRFVAQALRRAGLQSVSVQDFLTEVEKNKDYYLELCRESQSRWVCVSRIPAEYKTRDGLAAYAEKLQTLIDELKPLGMELCFHGVRDDLLPIDGIDALEYLIKKLPRLSLCLDLYHVHGSGLNLEAVIRKFAGRVCMVHFKDYRTENGESHLVPPGQGEIDWKDAIDACLETNVPYGFIEQEKWDSEPIALMKQGLDWLTKELALRENA